ncbi:MAG: hypothetical protein ACRYGG_06085 [Janthinobacterium lividum]
MAIFVSSLAIKLTWFYTCVWKVKCASSTLACVTAMAKGLANTSLIELVSTVGLSVLDLTFCFWPPIFIFKAILLMAYLKDLPRFAQAIDTFILAFQALYLWYEYRRGANPLVANVQRPPFNGGDDDDDHRDEIPLLKKQLDSVQKAYKQLAKKVEKLLGRDRTEDAELITEDSPGTVNNPIRISDNRTVQSLVTGVSPYIRPLPMYSSPIPAENGGFEIPRVFHSHGPTVPHRPFEDLTVVSPLRIVRIIRL